ncbi:hypothetical protein M0802_014487 [Mischocyttarus mexicanus]|nr:hypothetical protein M0802_014493 [Mischocyttarus mexicanus]KAI4478765.1 hypothetical protein M0802_014487 [Mischocyttarus mexicanus]
MATHQHNINDHKTGSLTPLKELKVCVINVNSIITNKRRHCARKAIYTDAENLPEGSWVYSAALSDKDSSCCARLAKDYWWLQGDAKHMDEVRRRARFKKLANMRVTLRNRVRRRARPAQNEIASSMTSWIKP